MLASDSPSQPQPSAARHKRATEIECGPGSKDDIEKEDEIWVVHRPINTTHSRFFVCGCASPYASISSHCTPGYRDRARADRGAAARRRRLVGADGLSRFDELRRRASAAARSSIPSIFLSATAPGSSVPARPPRGSRPRWGGKMGG
jgi:hypothetical protein